MRTPFAAALLAAVLASPVGAAPVPSGREAAPLDLTAVAVSSDVRQALELLGYRVDDKAGRIFLPGGAPLSVGAWKVLGAPYSLRAEPLSDLQRQALIFQGYRFAADAVLSPRTKKPASSLEIRLLGFVHDKGAGHLVLERAELLLGRQDPSKPVPPEVRERLLRMDRIQPGALPAGVPEILKNAPQSPAGPMAEAVGRAYRDSTRFFDGHLTLQDLAAMTLPKQRAGLRPARPPVYFDEAERRLGGAVQARVAERLAKSKTGWELLASFPKKAGRPRLPKIVIVELQKEAGAFYNPQTRAVYVNRRYVLDQVAAAASKGKRAALRRRLRDPAKLAAYLEKPGSMDRFLDRYGGTFVHELTHYRQDVRDPFFAEQSVGNVPGAMSLEYEHEAFLAENRHFHEQLMADPDRALRSPEAQGYIRMISDPDVWLQDIDRVYRRSWPQAAARMPTMKALQKVRAAADAAPAPWWEIWTRFVRSQKAVGRRLGDRAIAAAEARDRKRMEAFRKNEYPKMAADGFGKLGGAYARRGEIDQAFYARLEAERRTAGRPELFDGKRRAAAGKEAGAAAVKAAAWLKAGAGPIERRLNLASALAHFYNGRRNWPVGAADIVNGAYRNGGRRYLSRANDEPDAVKRSSLLDRADRYADAAGDEETLKKIEALRSGRVERRGGRLLVPRGGG